jgi:predicted neuraminidase
MNPFLDPISRREGIRAAILGVAALFSGCAGRRQGAQAARPVEVLREFVYDEAPFPSCHASTVAEVRRQLVAAWFGGTAEGRDDVCIYLARRGRNGWSEPEKVAEGVVEGDLRRYPCWNPVLFQPRRGPLLLFYKVGPRPSSWWGMVRSSSDEGRTWSPARRLPEGHLGPVRAKPVQLRDGTLVCGSSTEHEGWRVHMEFTRPPMDEWWRTDALNTAEEWGAIQPTVLLHRGGVVQILCRSRQEAILEAWSQDHGRTWSPLRRTELPNPSAGIDAVRLRDGRFLLVYNHTRRGRGNLNVAVSKDGRGWFAGHVLEDEPGEFSYPAVIQTRDGMVHVTYTWKRQRIRHVVLDPDRLEARPMRDGTWPELAHSTSIAL